MHYKLYPVPEALQGYIRYFWSYDSERSDLGRLHVKSFADRFPRLVYQDTSNFSPILSDKFGLLSRCYLSGVDTVSSSASWDGAFSHFGVSFFPHALAVIFGINAEQLTNTNLDIVALDRNAVVHRLDAATSHQERLVILCRYFLDKLTKAKPDTIITALMQQPNLLTLNDTHTIARRVHISGRQLQRRFKEQVGISLKKYQRILSFEQSLKLLQSAKYGDLTRVAHQLGYFDQAHFNRDFVDFSGTTPLQFIKQHNLGSESSSFIYPAK